MVPNKEAAARHLPVAHSRDLRGGAHEAQAEVRRTSEPRLTKTVVKRARRGEMDRDAELPCTD